MTKTPNKQEAAHTLAHEILAKEKRLKFLDNEIREAEKAIWALSERSLNVSRNWRHELCRLEEVEKELEETQRLFRER